MESVEKESIDSGTHNTYQGHLKRIREAMEKAKKPFCAPGSVEEMATIKQCALDEVESWRLAPATIIKGWHSAIAAYHAEKKLEGTSWTQDVSWGRFKKGLAKRGKPPQWRLPWPFEIVLRMIAVAFEDLQSAELACSLLFLFFGMARKAHIQEVLMSDVHSRNPTEGHEQAKVAFGNIPYYYVVVLVNIKTEKIKARGKHVRVPDYHPQGPSHEAGIFAAWMGERSKLEGLQDDPRLFPRWNAAYALAFVKEFARVAELDTYGYKCDLHGLRCGAAVYYTTLGVPREWVIAQALWAKDSKMIFHYSAILPPEVMKSCDLSFLTREHLVGLKPAPKKVTTQSALVQKRAKRWPPAKDESDVHDDDDIVDATDEDESDDESEEFALTDTVRCKVCEKDVKILLTTPCTECGENVHQRCSYYKKCFKCTSKRPKWQAKNASEGCPEASTTAEETVPTTPPGLSPKRKRGEEGAEKADQAKSHLNFMLRMLHGK